MLQLAQASGGCNAMLLVGVHDRLHPTLGVTLRQPLKENDAIRWSTTQCILQHCWKPNIGTFAAKEGFASSSCCYARQSDHTPLQPPPSWAHRATACFCGMLLQHASVPFTHLALSQTCCCMWHKPSSRARKFLQTKPPSISCHASCGCCVCKVLLSINESMHQASMLQHEHTQLAADRPQANKTAGGKLQHVGSGGPLAQNIVVP